MTYKETRVFESRLYSEIEDALEEVGETGREFSEPDGILKRK